MVSSNVPGLAYASHGPSRPVDYSHPKRLSDNHLMRSTFPRSAFAALTRAATKSGASRLRQLGLLPVRVDWVARATVCERCPMRVVKCGVSYCGTPFLGMPVRDPLVDGCGCPTRAKAQDPEEHCPIDSRHRAPTDVTGECTCKWCSVAGMQAASSS